VTRGKRSPTDDDAAEVLSLRMSARAKRLLEDRADRAALPLALYARQVMYRHLGLIKGDS
jgi:hypothetical protein